jgi:predicted Rossmann fold flavoprotein
VNKSTDVIILGGGAAGLMSAIEAGHRSLSVIILEHNDRLGKKLLASGGGRCNFTNLKMSAAHFISENKHFSKSALARFSPSAFIDILDENGIGYVEEKNGQLFCKKTSSDIVSLLEAHAKSFGVEMIVSCEVSGVRHDKKFVVTTSSGEFESKSLVVATGGLSYKELGASDIGFKIARSFGHKITKLSPALTPFILDESAPIETSTLAGVSCSARVCVGKQCFTDDILFTHRGLSGPAMLQISSHWSQGDKLSIDLLPGQDIFEELKTIRNSGGAATIKTLLSHHLPNRLAKELSKNLDEKRIDQYSDKELHSISTSLHNLSITPRKIDGYEKAEVTRGGINTDEISSQTMESKLKPNLFFVGEVIDVTGELGGYNLHWAWASGHACGRNIQQIVG